KRPAPVTSRGAAAPTSRRGSKPKIEAPETTPPPAEGKGKVHQIQVWLPKAHLEMLSKEADLIRVPRANLLMMLLQKRRSGFIFERPASAPKYTFQPKDFEDVVRYTWYMDTEMKRLLDQDRMLMGNLTIASWVIVVLNQYVGWEG